MAWRGTGFVRVYTPLVMSRCKTYCDVVEHLTMDRADYELICPKLYQESSADGLSNHAEVAFTYQKQAVNEHNAY